MNLCLYIHVLHPDRSSAASHAPRRAVPPHLEGRTPAERGPGGSFPRVRSLARPSLRLILSVPLWWHLANTPLSGVFEATCPDPTEAMKAALKWGARRARRPAEGAAGQPLDVRQQISSPSVELQSTCRADRDRLDSTRWFITKQTRCPLGSPFAPYPDITHLRIRSNREYECFRRRTTREEELPRTDEAPQESFPQAGTLCWKISVDYTCTILYE